jgi:hypothetical protein
MEITQKKNVSATDLSTTDNIVIINDTTMTL